MTRVFIAVPVSEASSANDFIVEATGNLSDSKTFNESSVKLSADGTEPATHYMAVFRLTDNFQTLMGEKGVPSYASVEYDTNLTLDEFSTNLGLQKVEPEEPIQ